MIIYLPERIYKQVKNDNKISKYSAEINDLWGVGFPSMEKLKKINTIGIHYMSQVFRLVKNNPVLKQQLELNLRETDAINLIGIAMDTRIDKENRLDALYRLVSTWINPPLYSKTFIDIFESLSKEEIANLSANIVKAYFIIRTGFIDSDNHESFIKKLDILYNQIKGIYGENDSLEKMLAVEYLDQVILYAKNNIGSGKLKLSEADTFIDTAIEKLKSRLSNIPDSDYLLYNTRFLYYYLYRLSYAVQTNNSSREHYRSTLMDYATLLVVHKDKLTRSLYTHNEWMFGHFIILLNATIMLANSDEAEYIMRELSNIELEYISSISQDGKFAMNLSNKFREILPNDFGISVLKYYESEIYSLIEPILLAD